MLADLNPMAKMRLTMQSAVHCRLPVLAPRSCWSTHFSTAHSSTDEVCLLDVNVKVHGVGVQGELGWVKERQDLCSFNVSHCQENVPISGKSPFPIPGCLISIIWSGTVYHTASALVPVIVFYSVDVTEYWKSSPIRITIASQQ